MDRRSIDAALDALSRTELRNLVGALLRWIGPDAAARVVPNSPFIAADSQAQLPLTAIDTAAAARRIRHLAALGVAIARVSGGDLPQVAARLADPHLVRDLLAAFEDVANETTRAIAYDLRAGLDLVDTLADALSVLRAADQEFRRHGDTAPISPDLAPVIEAIEARLGDVALDESDLRALIALTRRLAALRGDEQPYRLVAAAITTTRNPDARTWLMRLLERDVSGAEAVSLLRVLAESIGSDDEVERFVQVAELHLGAEDAVIELIVTTLHARDRVDEARFWIGEGRLRFPDGVRWSALEEQLF